MLKLNERIFRFCMNDLHGRAVLGRTGIDPAEAIVVDGRLSQSFIERRYPQMRDALSRRRAPSGSVT